MNLRSIAQQLGGNVAGGQIVFPPPGHSRQDRSACLRFDERAPNGFIVHSFAGEDPLPIRDYVRSRLGIEGRVLARPADPIVRELKAGPSDEERSDRALSIWRRAEDPRGTPVEAYLVRRGLTLDVAGTALRWHPACPFAGQRVGAMVAIIRDVRTDKPVAIHRTALNADGSKMSVEGKDRLAYGPIAGGAVKLTPDALVTTAIGVGEGIETTLSLQLVPEFGASPVWALISAGGVGAFPVLPGIECLWIAVDDDPAGHKAARACSDRWRKAGRETFLVRPTVSRADLNDLVGRSSHA